jgi:hypothetical protein
MIDLSPEVIVVAVAILIFYLRIALLRGKKKRLERELALKRRNVKGRSKGAPLLQKEKGAPPYAVTSWLLVVLAVLLMLGGVVAKNRFSILGWNIIGDPEVVATYSMYWHWVLSAGVILFALCFKVDVPKLETSD